MTTKLAFLLIPVLAACSSSSSVVPLTVSASEYQNWTCQQLADEQMRLSIATMVGSPESNAARSADERREYDAVTQTLDRQECGAPKPIIARAG
jgi:hypothetical protein